jgi:hypothetical protein
MTFCSFVRYAQVQNPFITPLLYVQSELSTHSSLVESEAIKEPVKQTSGHHSHLRAVSLSYLSIIVNVSTQI